MPKTKVIIIDDEKLARSLIRNYLCDFKDIEIVDECSNGFDGIKSINKHKPDLIFLDIKMPKLTGFEMLELIEDNYNIVFTTAYDQFALKAFEVNAIDYLLKPFSRERFADAVNKVLNKINVSESTKTELPSLHNISGEKLNRIVVKKNDTIFILPTETIKFLEAQDDYVKIAAESGVFLKQNRMKFYEENLPNYFVRVHRSFLVNLNEIKEIALLEKDNHIVVLKDGNKIPVSKNGYKRLKEIIRK